MFLFFLLGITGTVSQPLIGSLPLAGVSVATRIGVENTGKSLLDDTVCY
jgi:hypothetical protein